MARGRKLITRSSLRAGRKLYRLATGKHAPSGCSLGLLQLVVCFLFFSAVYASEDEDQFVEVSPAPAPARQSRPPKLSWAEEQEAKTRQPGKLESALTSLLNVTVNDSLSEIQDLDSIEFQRATLKFLTDAANLQMAAVDEFAEQFGPGDAQPVILAEQLCASYRDLCSLWLERDRDDPDGDHRDAEGMRDRVRPKIESAIATLIREADLDEYMESLDNSDSLVLDDLPAPTLSRSLMARLSERLDERESDAAADSGTWTAGGDAGSSKSVYVRGYHRKDGTYVRPHYRSRPRRK